MAAKNQIISPTPYPDLNEVLQTLVSSIQEILAHNFVGAYLQGSFAVGDFDEHSDVDFIVAVERPLSEAEVAALQEMHGRVYHLPSPWAQHLEGSYFPKAILQDAMQRGKEVWFLDHGSQELVESDHCNTYIVRWVVRERGVVLAGPSPAGLIPPVSADQLRREIFEVIQEWGQEILEEPDRFNNRFYQGFIVLSYCRMLHDLHTGVNNSKRAGAVWAQQQLDPAWAGLIDRTWACRPDPATAVRQQADPADFGQTLAFVRHIMDESRAFAAEFWPEFDEN